MSLTDRLYAQALKRAAKKLAPQMLPGELVAEADSGTDLFGPGGRADLVATNLALYLYTPANDLSTRMPYEWMLSVRTPILLFPDLAVRFLNGQKLCVRFRNPNGLSNYVQTRFEIATQPAYQTRLEVDLQTGRGVDLRYRKIDVARYAWVWIADEGVEVTDELRKQISAVENQHSVEAQAAARDLDQA